jgi:hypothetical protein
LFALSTAFSVSIDSTSLAEYALVSKPPVSSTNLQIVFEGPAVKACTIDARLLAESLFGYSEVFTRANAILNGEASQAVVLVESDFKRGSFVADLQFVQNILDQAQHLITGHPFYDASGIAGIIGLWKNKEIRDSVIDLFKWLRGKKPDKTAPADNNNTEITLGQNKKTVNNVTVNLYGDSAIRSGLGHVTAALRQAPIERITIKQNGIEQTTIEKSEAGYFEPEPFQLESDDAPLEGQRDTVLIVSKLAFTENATWTFLERGAIVIAKIEDDEFWKQVHDHKITFGEGDRLRVRLKWETVRKRNKLTAKNTVAKVLEVLVKHQQPRLEM